MALSEYLLPLKTNKQTKIVKETENASEWPECAYVQSLSCRGRE